MDKLKKTNCNGILTSLNLVECKPTKGIIAESVYNLEERIKFIKEVSECIQVSFERGFSSVVSDSIKD